MLSETLSKGLEAYGIGAAIRALRLEKDLGLEQLSKHTGLSAAMLSRIETGQIFPTLPTLLRISMVFGVGLDHFFATKAEKPVVEVVRREERLRLPNVMEGPALFHFESLDFPVQDRAIETFLADFSSSTPTDPHSHSGIEFVYVMKGGLEIELGGEVQRLNEGDAIYFDSGPEHSYSQYGSEICSAIVVICPDK
jgi:transcriptional regulator with XRE-family HTH domain